MLRKSLIAAATALTLAVGLTAAAPEAEARHRHHHGGGIGLYFGFPGYYGYNGYYDDGWGYYPHHRLHHRGKYHCHWVKVKKHHKWRMAKRCHRHGRW